MSIPAELDARFRAAAAAEGLLDAACSLVETPVGTLLVAATDAGICRVSFDDGIDAVAASVGARVLRVPGRGDPARGRRAARAVGGALNRTPIPILLPCHRVVGASGSLVGNAGGLDRKRLLLELE